VYLFSGWCHTRCQTSSVSCNYRPNPRSRDESPGKRIGRTWPFSREKVPRALDDYLRVTPEITGYTPRGLPSGRRKRSWEHSKVVRTGLECRPAARRDDTLVKRPIHLTVTRLLLSSRYTGLLGKADDMWLARATLVARPGRKTESFGELPRYGITGRRRPGAFPVNSG
jgi:hypothetical protein